MENKRTPSCPNCGSPTLPSTVIHTVQIGGPEDDPSTPVVEATVKIEIPCYTCVRAQCGTSVYGSEGQEIIDRCTKSLTENCYGKY
jgi:hypothetical protein